MAGNGDREREVGLEGSAEWGAREGGQRQTQPVLGVQLCAPKRYTEVLTPSTYAGELIWEQALCRCHQVE